MSLKYVIFIFHLSGEYYTFPIERQIHSIDGTFPRIGCHERSFRRARGSVAGRPTTTFANTYTALMAVFCSMKIDQLE